MARENSKNSDGIFEPFAAEEVAWEEFSHGRRFGSRFRKLTDFGGGSHVGVSLEELPPGRQSSPFHFHMLEEESLYVLAGTATLRLGPKRYALKAGDFCCFPAGQKAGHCLINEGTEVFRFLMIGERNPNEVTVYPDTGRVGVRALKQGFRQNATMEYWEGVEG
jgi:uncharacterized cupin superfamily protein